jgi:hypothetical protein
VPSHPQHGDLWPGNIIQDEHGRWCVIDYETFGQVEFPLYDAYHLVWSCRARHRPTRDLALEGRAGGRLAEGPERCPGWRGPALRTLRPPGRRAQAGLHDRADRSPDAAGRAPRLLARAARRTSTDGAAAGVRTRPGRRLLPLRDPVQRCREPRLEPEKRVKGDAEENACHQEAQQAVVQGQRQVSPERRIRSAQRFAPSAHWSRRSPARPGSKKTGQASLFPPQPSPGRCAPPGSNPSPPGFILRV